jgi:photosystem II stability/assembly factor-like uncharacterized protein
MKSLAAPVLLAAALLATFAGSAAAQTWTPVTDVGHTGAINNIFFVNANVGYVTTNPAAEYKTTDGGQSWTKLPTVSQQFSDFFFITPDTGWGSSAGAGGIRKTTNGGATWTTQLAGSVFNDSALAAIQFLNPSVGYAAGGIRVMKTTNGGTTWTTHNPDVLTNPSATSEKIRTRAMHFVNEQVGFVVGEGGIRRTTDGGATWKHVYTGTISDIHFPTTQIGYAAGQQATIIKSVDGGETWVRQSDSIPDINPLTGFLALQCLNVSVCYAAGFETSFNWRLYRTTNGSTWTEILKSTSGGMQTVDLHFPDSTGGYLISYNGKVYKSGPVPAPTALTAVVPTSGENGLRLSRSATGWNLGYSLATDRVVTVSLRDLQGRSVWSSSFHGTTGRNVLTIPSSAVSTGVQILEFRAGGATRALLLPANRLR